MTIKHSYFFTPRRNPLFISQCLYTTVIFTKDERQGNMTLLPMIYAVLFEIYNPSEPFGLCLFMISQYLILQPTFFIHTANRLLAIILETYTMIFQNTHFLFIFWIFNLKTEFTPCLKRWLGGCTYISLKHFMFPSPSFLFQHPIRFGFISTSATIVYLTCKSKTEKLQQKLFFNIKRSSIKSYS